MCTTTTTTNKLATTARHASCRSAQSAGMLLSVGWLVGRLAGKRMACRMLASSQDAKRLRRKAARFHPGGNKPLAFRPCQWHALPQMRPSYPASPDKRTARASFVQYATRSSSQRRHFATRESVPAVSVAHDDTDSTFGQHAIKQSEQELDGVLNVEGFTSASTQACMESQGGLLLVADRAIRLVNQNNKQQRLV